MHWYTVFEITTGKIRDCGSCSERATIWIQPQPGEWVLPIKSNPETQYVDGVMLVDRPAISDGEDVSILADGEDEYALTGLPPGTRLDFGAETFVVDDGEFIFSTALAGQWIVEVIPPFPFQRQTLRVIANAV